MKRRKFIGRTLAGGAVAGAGLSSIEPGSALAYSRRKEVVIREQGKYDILLKGGHVIDPGNNINSPMDVAITEGKIAVVGKNLPANDAKRTIDVSGLYVSPGFIDIHIHAFYTFKFEYYNYRWIIPDDFSFPYGVTTNVDAGSSGVYNFDKFKEIIDSSVSRLLAFINISAPGMDANENEPATFKIALIQQKIRKYQDLIVGIKTAHYGPGIPYDDIHTPWASVDAAVRAGELAGLPVMFDYSARPAQGKWPERTYRELILEHGRPGDIHTHFLSKTPYVENGKPSEDLYKARDRGFIFDLGHGGGSFRWEVAVPVVMEGKFYPDSISTDLHSHNTSNGKVLNMANVMSKCLALRMPLEEVIRCSTVNPAREINRPELGSMKVGNTADIAVFEVLNKEIDYIDARGGKMSGDKEIHNIMTLFGGEVAFDPWGLNALFWQNMPVRRRRG
ncbi:MAG: amidohydrolase/deacetylase family metallohydrolase [Candidatus Latescibacteria bacterium]|jgi:dihydroorotase|nr:amidohydrolase/deacetylase family metallohydrolase [Candidatus Latescibacterota bacterium]